MPVPRDCQAGLRLLIFAGVLLAGAACGNGESSNHRTPPAQADKNGEDAEKTDPAKDGETSESNKDPGESESGSRQTPPGGESETERFVVPQDADFVMGALGDSITKALNIESPLVESVGLSWSTGDRQTETPKSHFDYLNEQFDRQIAGFNAAVSGARSNALKDQVDRLLPTDPDYVTLLIGANDVCDWPANHSEPLETFKDNVSTAVDRLVSQNENVKINMPSVPDVYQLYQLKKDEAQCREFWSTVGFCQPLLGEDLTTDQRLAFRERWKDLNGALREISESYADNVSFNEEVSKTKFKDKHVSDIDCFHPSAAGQELIAEKTWNEKLARKAVKAASP